MVYYSQQREKHVESRHGNFERQGAADGRGRVRKEWAARPAGCWGIYQIDNGTKRFYLVQKDSKYDKRNGFSVLVK